jgi:hypothetical protein
MLEPGTSSNWTGSHIASGTHRLVLRLTGQLHTCIWHRSVSHGLSRGTSGQPGDKHDHGHPDWHNLDWHIKSKQVHICRHTHTLTNSHPPTKVAVCFCVWPCMTFRLYSHWANFTLDKRCRCSLAFINIVLWFEVESKLVSESMTFPQNGNQRRFYEVMGMKIIGGKGRRDSIVALRIDSMCQCPTWAKVGFFWISTECGNCLEKRHVNFYFYFCTPRLQYNYTDGLYPTPQGVEMLLGWTQWGEKY